MANIMVVEDNPMNMELVTCILEQGDINVTQAFSGPEALSNIQNNSFDLILLDIQLPGIDGLEVLKNLKNDPATSYIPVVALTAHAMNGDEELFLSEGCIGYIAKPIEVPTFLDTVRSYMTKSKERT